MLRCLFLAMAVAVPSGTLLAAAPVPVALGTAANFGALAGGRYLAPAMLKEMWVRVLVPSPLLSHRQEPFTPQVLLL